MVFDASTLILLAKVDLLRWVTRQHEAVVTPEVESEATRQGSPDALLIALLVSQGLIVVAGTRCETRDVRRLQKDFGLAVGEATSLWLAVDRGDALATDDGPAIRACKLLEVPFVTAIHFSLAAFRCGALSRELAVVTLGTLAAFGRYHQRILDAAKSTLEGK